MGEVAFTGWGRGTCGLDGIIRKGWGGVASGGLDGCMYRDGFGGGDGGRAYTCHHCRYPGGSRPSRSPHHTVHPRCLGTYRARWRAECSGCGPTASLSLVRASTSRISPPVCRSSFAPAPGVRSEPPNVPTGPLGVQQTPNTFPFCQSEWAPKNGLHASMYILPIFFFVEQLSISLTRHTVIPTASCQSRRLCVCSHIFRSAAQVMNSFVDGSRITYYEFQNHCHFFSTHGRDLVLPLRGVHFS